MANNDIFVYRFDLDSMQIRKMRLIEFKRHKGDVFSAKLENHDWVQSDTYGCLWRLSEYDALLAALKLCESKVGDLNSAKEQIEKEILGYQTGLDALRGMLADNVLN